MPHKTLKLRARDAAVVYSRATGRVRRWAVSDKAKVHDSGLRPGEDQLLVPARYAQDLPTLQAYVTTRTGLTPGVSDRYVGIDIRTGRIVEVSVRDPLCGDASPPGMVHVRHDTADPTWSYDAATGVFTPPPTPAYTADQQAALARYHSDPRPTDWTDAERATLAGLGITV